MIDYPDSNAVGLPAAEPTRRERTDLPEMLRTIAETVGAYGCIIWQVERRSTQHESPPDLRLFALSEWFPDKQEADLHDLPQRGSVAGRVTLTQQSINIPDIWADDSHVYTADSFLTRARIKALCSVPVNFYDGAKGALNLYRRQDEPPFTSGDVARIERMAPLVDALYQATRDAVSVDLITAINELLEEGDLHDQERLPPRARIEALMQDICGLVATSFNCYETSIFLEDRFQMPQQYKLIATTWQESKPPKTCQKGYGLTGWVLERARPVRIYDLINFERDREMIEREYPGISWQDDLDVREMFFREKGRAYSAPYSYMAAPVMNGKRVCGVIRCSFTAKIPDYFADRELRLLQLIAAQIGQCWNRWLTERELADEERAWRQFVAGVGRLNEFVNKQLDRPEPEIKPIFDEALRVTATVVSGADILDIRLLDKEKRQLYFDAFHGQAWEEGGAEEQQQSRKKVFSLGNLPPQSAGDYVYQRDKTYVIPDVRQQQIYYDETFLETKRMIVAPIRVRNEIIGVLDIRGTGEGAFPEHAKHMAEVLGHLIGLYRNLVDEIGELKTISDELSREIARSRDLEKQRTEIAMNLAHQFNTPIVVAHARLDDLARELRERGFTEDDMLWKDCRAVRGLCGKAKRVSQNTKLLAELAEGKAGKDITAEPGWMTADALLKLLKEANADTSLLIAPRRNIRFYVDESSFDKPSHGKTGRIRELCVNKSMLEQAILNLLDNAAKYSYRNSAVRVYGGWTGSGRFHISVQNSGVKLEQSEVNRCTEYGWQSEAAKAVDGSGAGIGLWIVNHIMLAHGGELVIEATTEKIIDEKPREIRKATEFKLIFPEKYAR